MTQEVRIGCTARDIVTGFVGTVARRQELLNGNVQYCLQPKCSDNGSLPDALSFDYQTVEYVDDGVSHMRVIPGETSIKLGMKVRDKASGFEGVATMKTTFLNGCIYFDVVPRIKDGQLLNEVPNPSFLSQERLEPVELPVPEKPLAVPRTGTGGPINKPQRAR